jgi:hypothetical protein
LLSELVIKALAHPGRYVGYPGLALTKCPGIQRIDQVWDGLDQNALQVPNRFSKPCVFFFPSFAEEGFGFALGHLDDGWDVPEGAEDF